MSIFRSKTTHAWQIYCLLRSDPTAKETPPCRQCACYTVFFASLPDVHAKRLTRLLAAVEAVVSGSRLTLNAVGCGLPGPVAVKCIDRLQGFGAPHAETPKRYEALVRHSLTGISLAVYAQRMQIEESFRDLKGERFGLGFSAHRSRRKECLGVLPLVASLSSFVLRLIGEVGKARQMEFQFQGNTRRSRPVLSVITLALQLVQRGMAAFPWRALGATLKRLRYDHPALELWGASGSG